MSPHRQSGSPSPPGFVGSLAPFCCLFSIVHPYQPCALPACSLDSLAPAFVVCSIQSKGTLPSCRSHNLGTPASSQCVTSPQGKGVGNRNQRIVREPKEPSFCSRNRVGRGEHWWLGGNQWAQLDPHSDSLAPEEAPWCLGFYCLPVAEAGVNL